MGADRPGRRLIAPFLRPGDAVAVVSPAGPVKPGSLERGERFLRQQGYRVIRGRHALSRQGYFAGSDRQRLADLQRALDNPQVRAVFFSRGGYGTARLLPDLDLDALAAHPKIIMGFSDLTTLLNRITDRTGLVTYLGPMVAGDMGRGLRGRTLSSWRALIEGRGGAVAVDCRPGLAATGVRQGFLRPGEVTAELAGGCLSMIVGSLGTPYQPDLAGKILFWEEVNEPAYRIDRMLTQLRHSGLLDGLAGMVVGRLRGCGAAPGQGAAGGRRFLSAMVESLDCPVFFGFPAGHGPEKVVLPLGLPLTLDSTRGQVLVRGALAGL